MNNKFTQKEQDAFFKRILNNSHDNLNIPFLFGQEVLLISSDIIIIADCNLFDLDNKNHLIEHEVREQYIKMYNKINNIIEQAKCFTIYIAEQAFTSLTDKICTCFTTLDSTLKHTEISYNHETDMLDFNMMNLLNSSLFYHISTRIFNQQNSSFSTVIKTNTIVKALLSLKKTRGGISIDIYDRIIILNSDSIKVILQKKKI